MAIERIYHCDGPDCDRSVRCSGGAPRSRLLTVTWVAAGHRAVLHFCGWDCTLRFAATQEPEDVVQLVDGD